MKKISQNPRCNHNTNSIRIGMVGWDGMGWDGTVRTNPNVTTTNNIQYRETMDVVGIARWLVSHTLTAWLNITFILLLTNYIITTTCLIWILVYSRRIFDYQRMLIEEDESHQTNMALLYNAGHIVHPTK